MFLEEADFGSDADLVSLQAKLEQIRSFTAALFLDINEDEKQKYLAIKERFEQLKVSLFTNSSILLENAKHSFKSSEQTEMREAQINLMFDWEQFGLTEDMYLKIYQCQRNQSSDNQQTRERAILLTHILNIQTDLLLLFKMRQG